MCRCWCAFNLRLTQLLACVSALCCSQIPGGPKLARTPLGRTPATGCLLAPGSAVAQHQPGSGRAVHFAAGPGSASVGRYPGSAVALHRGGMTPQLAPQPMTFQVRCVPALAALCQF